MLLKLLLFIYKQQFHKEPDILASKELAKIKNGVVVHGFGIFYEELITREKPLKNLSAF